MEKQRNYTIAKSCKRLLTILIIIISFSSSLFAQFLSNAEINNLCIRPEENQNLFTNVEIKFSVLIPKIKASQVQVMSTSQQADVSFKSMRKNDDYENNGTLIELWYTFDKKGTYNLTALPVIIQNRKKNIRFSQITVEDDPAKQSPRIVIKFSDGTTVYSDHGNYSAPVLSAKVGEKLSLTIYLQYATQLVQFSWDIPKNSIFTQTQEFEITEIKYREKKYTHDLIPVATFDWTGLAEETASLPKIKLTATGYNGYKNELLLPEIKINFSQSVSSTYTNKNDNIFDDAFTQTFDQQSLNNQQNISYDDCLKLQELYSKERNSIFRHHSYKKARKLFEAELGLPVYTDRDYSVGQLYGAILILVGSILLLIISIREKRLFRILISTAIFFIAIVPFAFAIVKKTQKAGICTGCTVYSIPEDTAEASLELGAGNKIRIIEQTENWFYVELGESGGWCLKDNILVIK